MNPFDERFEAFKTSLAGTAEQKKANVSAVTDLKKFELDPNWREAQAEQIEDMREEVPFWGYFAQITDAATSYGGYSGAPPNEKITWGKLEPGTPRFFINSDAMIVAPLIFAYVLGD